MDKENDDFKKKAISFSKIITQRTTLTALRVAAKMCRDEIISPELNKGIDNPKERQIAKDHWSALDEFIKAYDELLPKKKSHGP